MATDTITRPTPTRFAEVLAELIDADATAGLFPKGHDAPQEFAALHAFTDANVYLLTAAEALGWDLFSEGGDFPTANAAMEIIDAAMAKPCDACGHALGPFAPRVTEEGTFHGLVCPADAHRVR